MGRDMFLYYDDFGVIIIWEKNFIFVWQKVTVNDTRVTLCFEIAILLSFPHDTITAQ